VPSPAVDLYATTCLRRHRVLHSVLSQSLSLSLSPSLSPSCLCPCPCPRPYLCPCLRPCLRPCLVPSFLSCPRPPPSLACRCAPPLARRRALPPARHRALPLTRCRAIPLARRYLEPCRTLPLQYEVTLLGCFSSDPSNFHWNAIKHLLHYVKAILDTKLPLIHSLPGKEFLVGFADADHAGDAAASKSTSGFLIYAHNILVMWKSKKQRLVAQSTMEAELVAITEAWKNLQWMGDVLRSLATIRAPPTVKQALFTTTTKVPSRCSAAAISRLTAVTCACDSTTLSIVLQSNSCRSGMYRIISLKR